ncbi:MAG TPA: CPBP family intramembrane glutamic endopeptidase [Mycobacteriales bacterium]|nr:CPBP family intramembrane glutamic endopeptidase [Mycobacteriales bacterium]
MRFRSGAIVGWTIGGLAFFALTALAVLTDPQATGGERAGAGAVGVALALSVWRTAVLGLDVRRDSVVVRSFFWSRKLSASALAGLAIEPVLRRNFARLVVVTTEGETVPVAFAAWRMRTAALQSNAMRAAGALGWVTGELTPGEVVPDRVEHPSAFTALLSDGRMVAVPALTGEPVLSPQLVERPGIPLLGWETVVVTVAFVLPATVTAIALFARHVAGVADLDEFRLPLPHHLPASLVLMIALYLTSAVVTPVALLLLARTGQWPRRLGLSKRALRNDALPAVGLLIGTWVTASIVALPFTNVFHNASLTNQQHNTHVPAYFVIYALVVSATTAVNEEVVVNGYVMTRLAQLGWRPWPSLALSLALRTSYHTYYGVGLIATVPFGYWATRSFQKHRRLDRPIIAHFLNDAILLTAAVLTS